MSQVRDIVQERPLFYVSARNTVAEAARRMSDLGVGAIVVLDGERLMGVFSERDLMKRVVLERRDAETTPVRDVMTTELVVIEQSATLEEAMEAMQSHNCRHLPVMGGDQVTGFISMRDLMNHELERKTEELSHIRAYVAGSV